MNSTSRRHTNQYFRQLRRGSRSTHGLIKIPRPVQRLFQQGNLVAQGCLALWFAKREKPFQKSNLSSFGWVIELFRCGYTEDRGGGCMLREGFYCIGGQFSKLVEILQKFGARFHGARRLSLSHWKSKNSCTGSWILAFWAVATWSGVWTRRRRKWGERMDVLNLGLLMTGGWTMKSVVTVKEHSSLTRLSKV